MYVHKNWPVCFKNAKATTQGKDPRNVSDEGDDRELNGPCDPALHAGLGENNGYREHYWGNWQNLNMDGGLVRLLHKRWVS